MRYDILVLGGGPAGLSAAVTARVRSQSVLVIGNRWQDSPLARAERVDNYLGLPARTGVQMLEEFYQHAQDLGVEFVTGRVVSAMNWNGWHLTVGSQVYGGAALILAPGVVRTAKYPGEETYLGRGVSYCATCDGMLYRNKSVVVLGLSADAPAEAEYLRSLGCQVTYLAPKKSDKLEIKGEQTVTAVNSGGEDIPCDGVFILREAVAPTDLFPGLETQRGAIVVDRRMATNLPGLFAAGDCTGAPLQVSKAVGEGLIAGLSAAEYNKTMQKDAETIQKG